jgi:hypothetical protein
VVVLSQGVQTADGGAVTAPSVVALTNPNTYAATHAAADRAIHLPGWNARDMLTVYGKGSSRCADLAACAERVGTRADVGLKPR